MAYTSESLTYFKNYLRLYLLYKILLHPKSETTFPFSKLPFFAFYF